MYKSSQNKSKNITKKNIKQESLFKKTHKNIL